MKIKGSMAVTAAGLLAGSIVTMGASNMNDLYAFKIHDIEGKERALSEWRGQVLLLVNVASKCGFTKQYAGLQELHDTYKRQGFAVLGFPANNFGRQEPGTNEEIQQFCSIKFGVTFPMFAKISVKGADQHPLYAFLTNKQLHPDFGGDISWNFNKFLVGRDGRIIARFGSRTAPADKELIQAIEKALAVPKP